MPEINLTTKSDVSRYFKQLEKYGFKVFNFQSNRAMGTGTVGMTDLLVIGRAAFEKYFIEIKIGRDRLSPEQIALRERLEPQGCWVEATEHNYKRVFENILTGWPVKAAELSGVIES
jgi:hypothetical protein